MEIAMYVYMQRMLLLVTVMSAMPLWVKASTVLQQNLAGKVALSVIADSWSESEMTAIVRPGFALKYPSNWKLASGQADYDPDRLFTINVAGGDSYVTIKIFKPSHADADDLMFSVLETLDGPMIETMSRNSFGTWGKIKGEGRHLKGKIAGFLPGGARLFVSVTNGRGILVTELYYSEDTAEALPGFDLIRNSFRFK